VCTSLKPTYFKLPRSWNNWIPFAVDTATRAEIRHYQNPEEGDGALMNRTVFLRLIQEIAQDYLARVRFTATAVAAIHEVVEEYMVTVFACKLITVVLVWY
jgi:histone H3/H4